MDCSGVVDCFTEVSMKNGLTIGITFALALVVLAYVLLKFPGYMTKCESCYAGVCSHISGFRCRRLNRKNQTCICYGKGKL